MCYGIRQRDEGVFSLGLSSFPKDFAHFSEAALRQLSHEADAMLELIPSKNYFDLFTRCSKLDERGLLYIGVAISSGSFLIY